MRWASATADTTLWPVIFDRRRGQVPAADLHDLAGLSAVASESRRRTSVVVATVGLSFVGANVYYFHRWVFRYSSEGTSPTYANTPFAWKVGKYLLLAVVMAALWVWLARRPRELIRAIRDAPTGRVGPLAAIWAAYCAVVTLVAVPGSEVAREAVVWFIFVPLVLALGVVRLHRSSLQLLGRLGVALVVYHVVFLGVQLAYYFADRRLPALAYDGGLVRFGAGLDDPNGFGVMVVLPITLTVTLWNATSRHVRSLALLVGFAVLLFVPLSFSAAIGCIVALAALSPILRRLRILFQVCGAALVIGVLLLQSSYVRGVVDAKSRSALGRFDFGRSGGLSDYLDDITIGRALFGAPDVVVASENSYVVAFSTFGLVGLVILLAVIVIAAQRSITTSWRAADGGHRRVAAIYAGLGAYIIGFAVAALGVPFFAVFPANMLFWIVALVGAAGPQLLADLGPGDEALLGTAPVDSAPVDTAGVGAAPDGTARDDTDPVEIDPIDRALAGTGEATDA